MAEFGLIGLGVMGKSLARNLADKGFALALYNRRVDGLEEEVAQNFIKEYPELSSAVGFEALGAFVGALEKPRRIFIMVKAGAATDAVIDNLLEYIEADDVIIDGGNAFYKDTDRRFNTLKERGVHFVGSGVSGGEEGALKGPSIMPGGSKRSFEIVSPYLTAIAAKDKNGQACCAHIGIGGAGHFVKMIHNGIEYAEMQLLAELVTILKSMYGLTQNEIADIFTQWTSSESNSYLLEITADILRKKEGDKFLLDSILDQAGNKGTGGWSTAAATELGVPATMIASALFARYTSAWRNERLEASQIYKWDGLNSASFEIESLRAAYQAARIINHHQGFHLIDEASKKYQWHIDLSELARVWTNGCIIRSHLMESLVDVLKSTNRLLINASIHKQVNAQLGSLKHLCALGNKTSTPMPCFQTAFQFILAYSTEKSAANVIQAQRDYFGAHTYKHVDDPSGPSHHTIWNND